MALEPALLTSISQRQVDPLASQSRAFQLKDLMSQEQLSQMQLGQQKQQIEQQNQIRGILGKSDLSTFEGQQKAASEVTKINPEMGMKLLQEFQQAQKGKQDLTSQQYDIMNKQLDLIGSSALSVQQKYNDLVSKGVSDTQARAMVQPLYQQTIQQLAQSKLDNGQPALGPEQMKFIQQNPTFDPQVVSGIVTRSNQARQQLQTILAQRKQETTERGEAEKERHDLAMEAFKAGENDQVVDDKTADAMADQYLAGDSTIFQNLGRGKQGAQSIIKVRQKIYEKGKEMGLSSKDIAAKIAEFKGIMAGERALGTRTAQIGMAGGEFENMAPLSLKASEAVPRTEFVPLNKAEQIVQRGKSSPELAKFVAATNSLINIYARAINPSGVPTDSDKEHAREMLNTAQSKQAYKAVVEQLQAEIAAAKKGPGTVREEFRSAVTGEQPQQPTQGNVVDWSQLQ